MGSIWSQKGATLSDKSARQEFGLSQEEIVAAIRAGKLQFRQSNMHGNPWFRLRELITNDSLTCHCPTGYVGTAGQLWYVRLLPSWEPQIAPYWIAMTTPYILIDASKQDWIAFLKRTMLQFDEKSDTTQLHHLMKYGSEPNYWNEFVFQAYHHHQHDAIFLAGLPDVKGSLSHA